MKAIQVTIDEDLLAALDADEDVKRYGRSEVLRRAAAEYLERRRAAVIEARYRRAYGESKNGLGEEYDGWEDEGRWPR